MRPRSLDRGFEHCYAACVRLTSLRAASIGPLLTSSPNSGAIIEQSFAQLALNFIANIIPFVAGAVVAVAWHRKLLIGERAAAALPNGYVLRYIGVTLLIVLALFVPTFLLLFIFGALAAALSSAGPGALALAAVALFFPLIAAIVVGLRLSLVLPARAVGDTALRLRDSWAITEGNTWRLIAGTILSAVIPAVVLNLALWPIMFGNIPSIGSGEPNIAAFEAWMRSLALPTGLISMGYMLISMIGIGFLSFAYRHFRRTQAPSV